MIFAAWMERYSKAVGVVLVDWANLASFTGVGGHIVSEV